MNSFTRIIIASIMVLSTLALHYPSYRVVAELLIHNDTAENHSYHRHSNLNPTSDCDTCPDCSKDSDGHCHRIGCCDSIPSIFTFEQHDHSFEIVPAHYQSLLLALAFSESSYRTILKHNSQRGPPEFSYAHFFISLSHVPNAPPFIILV